MLLCLVIEKRSSIKTTELLKPGVFETASPLFYLKLEAFDCSFHLLVLLASQIEYIYKYKAQLFATNQVAEEEIPTVTLHHAPEQTVFDIDHICHEHNVNTLMDYQQKLRITFKMLLLNLEPREENEVQWQRLWNLMGDERMSEHKLDQTILSTYNEEQGPPKIGPCCRDIGSASKMLPKIIFSSSNSLADNSCLSISADELSQQAQYQGLLGDFSEVKDLMCPICMEDMQIGHMIIKTICTPLQDPTKDNIFKGHIFHEECFRGWLMKGDGNYRDTDNVYYKCPLCRSHLVPELPSKTDFTGHENLEESSVTFRAEIRSIPL